MEFFYIAVLAVLCLLGGVAVARFGRETREAKAAAREAGEQAKLAEGDIGALRLAKFEVERRLAAEEQKVARIPELEKALITADSRIELSRLAKVTAESQAAVARESVTRLEAALTGAKEWAAEAKAREAGADQQHGGLLEQIDALKSQIGQIEQSLAAKAEAVIQHEQAAAEWRQRLVAMEEARDQAIARLDALAQARTGLEATHAGAASQLQEKAQRLEALEAELQQARSEQARRLDSAAEVKSGLEASLAGAAAQLQEKTQRLAAVEAELQRARGEHASRFDAVAEAKSTLEASLASAAAQLQEKAQRLEAIAGELSGARAESEAARMALGGQSERLSALQEALEQERRHGTEKLAIIAGAREQMTQEFRALAEDVIRRHSQDLGQHNKDQIETVLTPLRERLVEFQQGLAHAYDESAKERAALADQIRKLSANSTQMASETQQLSALLKGKAEGLGAWGEVLLSSILDRSGLREGEDYVFRESYSPDGSQRLRPDVVISLPGDQRVLIDSKVPLIAFEAYVNAGNDADSQRHLASHAAAMSGHIRDLAERGPPPVAESRRDYTVMFVPVEGALAAALRQDPDLTGLAVENNIALATPGTLMMALRSVANVWQAERRNRRAEAIAERGGKLYDSFAAFLGDMELLGDHLVRARHAYEEALGRLSSGRDNLIGQVEALREMGVKPSTVLPRISAAERRFETGLDSPGESQREPSPES